jgi:molybdenum cofactor guanylyltransferase
MTADVFAGAGPLAGVHAALRWAGSTGAEGICCTPCDAPFVTSKLLRLLEPSAAAGDFSAIVPRSDGPLGFEPLFAWYSSGTVGLAERHLREGETSMNRFVEEISPVRMLSASEVAGAGDPSWLFHNVNTRADLEVARSWIDPAHEEGGNDMAGRFE